MTKIGNYLRTFFFRNVVTENTELKFQNQLIIIIILIDNFCISLFSGVHKLTALYDIF